MADASAASAAASTPTLATQARPPHRTTRRAPMPPATRRRILILGGSIAAAILLVVVLILATGRRRPSAVIPPSTRTPTTAHRPPPPSSPKNERNAEIVFKNIHTCITRKDWAKARGYLDRLTTKYGKTKFVAAHRAGLAALRKQLDAYVKGTPKPTPPKPVAPRPEPPAPQPPPDDDEGWTEWEDLFDGKTLKGWRVVDRFPVEAQKGTGKCGKVHVADGRVLLQAGDPYTGIAWTGDFPTVDYEITMEAMRFAGRSGFANIAFPIGQSTCLFQVGWQGVGLSFVDGQRAADNKTLKLMGFQNGRWYRARLRVTQDKIEAWIDEEKVIHLSTAGHQFSVTESRAVKPFGVFSCRTTGALRAIRLRRLKPEAAGAGFVRDGLLLSWEARDLVGKPDAKTLPDGSASANHGTLGGNTRLAEGPPRIELPGEGYLLAARRIRVEQVSIEAIFRSDATEGRVTRLYLFGATDGSHSCFSLMARGPEEAERQLRGHLTFGFFGDDDRLHTAASGEALAPGWHHGLGTFDGRQLALYLDGQLQKRYFEFQYGRPGHKPVSSGAYEGRIKHRAGTGELTLLAGGKPPGVARAGDLSRGAIAAIRLYRRGLSSKEVARNYRHAQSLVPALAMWGAGRPRPVPWTVYTKWPFDAAEAKRRQAETAKALGVPVEQDIDLGGGVKMTLVLIPAGEFLMGTQAAMTLEELKKLYGGRAEECERERPQHLVTISRPFWLGKCEVTQEQWREVMGNNPSQLQARLKNPVEQVTWHDCQAFLQKLSARSGKALRLPTEAEWEYACRAGTPTEFYFGDGRAQVAQYAWLNENSRGSTQPVGKTIPNAWSLHDMAGNVWEWCGDRFAKYAQDARLDPQGPPTGDHRVFRGGAWDCSARAVRSATRAHAVPETRRHFVGLRAAMGVSADRGRLGVARPDVLHKPRGTEADRVQAARPAETMVKVWDFAGAAAALEKTVGGASLPREVAVRVAQRREEIGRMAALRAKMIERVNTAKPPLRKSSLGLKGINADLVKADDQGITARRADGKTETFAWKDLDPDSVRRLVRYTAKTADDHLAAGILLLECSRHAPRDGIPHAAREDYSAAVEAAERHFAEARKGGGAIDRYLDPLAAAAFARAKALVEEGRGARRPRLQEGLAEAEAALAAIEKQYGKTPWFAAHRDDVSAARRQVEASTPRPSQPPEPRRERLDPSEANVQGAYLGRWKAEAGGGGKVVAKVVAQGHNTYKVYLTQYSDRGKTAAVQLDGKMEAGRVVFNGQGWSGGYSNGVVQGRTAGGGTFQLSRVVRKSPSLGKKPPRGAVVILGEGSIAELTKRNANEPWKRVEGGGVQIPRGGMQTRRDFAGSFDLHVEFRCPLRADQRSQSRGNSGVFLPCGEEIQVLDSFGMTTYKGGGCGAIYKWKDPDADAILPPLAWQTYDVLYQVRHDSRGNPRVTIYHNGIKIHDNVELRRSSRGGRIHFQDHGNPVCYRNIWLLPERGR